MLQCESVLPPRSAPVLHLALRGLVEQVERSGCSSLLQSEWSTGASPFAPTTLEGVGGGTEVVGGAGARGGSR